MQGPPYRLGTRLLGGIGALCHGNDHVSELISLTLALSKNTVSESSTYVATRIKGPWLGGLGIVAFGREPHAPCCCHVVTNTVMSEWFDLLNFGTPRGRNDETHRRPQSASPSPRERVAWQPSSSPHDAQWQEPVDVSTKSLSPPLRVQEQENTYLPPQISPSRMRTVRARRRARRTQAHAPYALDMYSYVPQAPLLHKTPTKPPPASPTSRFVCTQSDSIITSNRSNDTKNHPGSDDSFTRLIGEDELDAAVVEELALRQGW